MNAAISEGSCSMLMSRLMLWCVLVLRAVLGWGHGPGGTVFEQGGAHCIGRGEAHLHISQPALHPWSGLCHHCIAGLLQYSLAHFTFLFQCP